MNNYLIIVIGWLKEIVRIHNFLQYCSKQMFCKVRFYYQSIRQIKAYSIKQRTCFNYEIQFSLKLRFVDVLTLSFCQLLIVMVRNKKFTFSQALTTTMHSLKSYQRSRIMLPVAKFLNIIIIIFVVTKLPMPRQMMLIIIMMMRPSWLILEMKMVWKIQHVMMLKLRQA